MSSESEIILANSQPSPTFGDQARQIADRLRKETNLQVKLTAQILGAAAQIAENHDRLIDEVVDMVEEDLDQREGQIQSAEITQEQLKRRFKTLKTAKAHFGIKAASWSVLIQKINESIQKHSLEGKQNVQESYNYPQDRLIILEQEVKILHIKVDKILELVTQSLTHHIPL